MDHIFSAIPLALILCGGIFVQSATGFAAGLMIVPALLWFGYTIPAAQCALLVATIPQNAWGVWSFRQSLTVRRVAWPGLGRVIMLPVGAWVLYRMQNALQLDTIRQIVGGFVLSATLAILVFRPQPQPSLSPIWAIFAFPISGFLQGLVGMGGPIMVFWVQAHDWGTRQTRAFMFAMYLISIIPALVVLYLFFGSSIIPAGLIAAAMTPLLLVVTYYGLRMGSKLGRDRLRRVSLAILFLMGLSGLAAPWLTR